MTYLAHTASAQLGALWLSCVGWTITAVALGLIQWRVWEVSDTEVISSGVAWVGLWRACFNSHTLVSPGFFFMHCRYISLTEDFTPPDIVAGQVLMLLSLVAGLCGNAVSVYALRNVFFGLKNSQIRLTFVFAGVLCLSAAVMALIPLLWNLNSVVTNQTIKFPPEFYLPEAPDSQYVGPGIWVGMTGAVLMIVSGIVFLTYRLPPKSRPRIQPSLREGVRLDLTLQPASYNQGALSSSAGKDNAAYESYEHL